MPAHQQSVGPTTWARLTFAAAALFALAELSACGWAKGQSPQPTVTALSVADKTLEIPLPPDMCAVPGQILQKVQAATQGAHVLYAGLDCNDLKVLKERRQTVARHSMEVMVHDEDFAPATRRAKARYLADCESGIPTAASHADEDRELAAFNRTHSGIIQTLAMAPGIVWRTKDAGIGNTVISIHRASDTVLEVELTVCIAPAGVPMEWIIQAPAYPQPGLSNDQAADRIAQALLQEAVKEVDSAYKLNGA